jgi:protein TonB
LLKYLHNNVVYPARALLYGISGRVFCQFVVGTTGQIANIKILRGADKDLDKEAFRIVAGSPPKWRPAENRGIKIPMYYQLPITFSLEPDRRGNRRGRF